MSATAKDDDRSPLNFMIDGAAALWHPWERHGGHRFASLNMPEDGRGGGHTARTRRWQLRDAPVVWCRRGSQMYGGPPTEWDSAILSL